MGPVQNNKSQHKEKFHHQQAENDDFSGDEEEDPELPDTVFMRNLATFDTTQESLKEYVEKNFGETVYCLICKDKESGLSKGTAFVKFKSADSAMKCLEEFEDPEFQTKFFLDGRNIFVLPALTRDKISEVKRAKAPAIEAEDKPKKKKKPRHNRPRPQISKDKDNSNTPEAPKNKVSKKKFQGKKTNKPFVTRDGAQKKGSKRPDRPSKGGKRVKGPQKKKKNKPIGKKSSQASRGRH